MNNKLSVKLSAVLVSLTACILVIFTVVLVLNIHYHFEMLQTEQAGPVVEMSDWGRHIELAIVQSILWTLLGSLVVTLITSIYLAKKISAPLVEMKSAAATMAHGKLTARTHVRSKDELGQLGEAINHLAERLQEQESLRNSITDNIAHELRTPLTTLKSHLIAMRDGIWQPTPDRLQACCEEIDRLTLLVEDLQELNDLQSTGITVHKTKISLYDVILDSIAAVQAAFREKRIETVLKLQAEATMQGDPNRLKQVFLNLLSNALKYTPHGGTVSLELRAEKRVILVRLSDNGPGITPADLPYIFERLYRGDKSRNRATGGSGIGLAIAKAIVEAHDGEIWADSSSAGATFHIRFPRED